MSKFIPSHAIPESNSELTCKVCGDSYTLRPECEATEFCDLCAQTILARIAPMVPEPPNAITWEHGVEILNALQKEIYRR